MTSSDRCSILAVITYFDLFDYPLTSTEIWKFQWRGNDADQNPDNKSADRRSCYGASAEKRRSVSSLFEVIEKLKELEEDGRVASGNGFYFLPGREALVKTRNLRHVIAYRKWRRALCIIRLLRMFPYVRMIAVANTLAYDNTDEESDIDLFIVTAKGRVWTARFFVVLFLQLFGLRPTAKTRRDKICACFFVDETHLNLQSLALQELPITNYQLPKIPDIYLCYWIATLWPVYNPSTGSGDTIYEKFFEANKWVRANVPNIHAIIPNIFRRVEATPRLQRIAEWKARLFPESFYRRLQERRFPKIIRDNRNKDTSVIIRDDILKFHTHDRREEYRRKFLTALAPIISTEVEKT